MTDIAVNAATDAESYLHQKAERLVLEGYRLMSATADADVAAPTEAVLRFHQATLGTGPGKETAVALERFIAALNANASGSLIAYKPGSLFLSQDELLLLGTIAGIQHWDEEIFRLCLRRLCRKSGLIKVAASAEALTVTLRNFGMILKPLPSKLRGRIIRQAETISYAHTGSQTLH
jgi:hypothetical protein